MLQRQTINIYSLFLPETEHQIVQPLRGDKMSFSDQSGSWPCYTKLLKFLSVSADTLVEMEGDLTLMI